jgi:thiamine-phosphate pyrophosphorylase
MLPRLHLITDDAVLSRPEFPDWAEAILAEQGARVAVHLRARNLTGRALFQMAERLRRQADACILINERVDVALAGQAAGVQLPVGGLPVAETRALLGADRWIGCSVHSRAEAAGAAVAGADFLLAGTIYASETHPAARAQGTGFLGELSRELTLPVIAIGGIDAERVTDCTRAGAYGVAVIRAVWSADDPARAVRRLRQQLEVDDFSV